MYEKCQMRHRKRKHATGVLKNERSGEQGQRWPYRINGIWT